MAKPNKTVKRFRASQKAGRRNGYWSECTGGNDRKSAYKLERDLLNKGFKVKITKYRVGPRANRDYNYRVWKWIKEF